MVLINLTKKKSEQVQGAQKRPWEGYDDELAETVNQIGDMMEDVKKSGDFYKHPVWMVVFNKIAEFGRDPSGADFSTLAYFVSMRELVVQIQERKKRIKDVEEEMLDNATNMKKNAEALKAVNEELAAAAADAVDD